MKNTRKGGGLTLPMGEEQGQYMHLKNWSLIYPGNGSKPEFAPIHM